MTLSYSKLKIIAFGCLALPSVLFVLGFLRWYVGIPVAAAILAAYLFSLRDHGKHRDVPAEERATIHISHGQFWLLVGIVTVWCFLSGLGNLYYQSDDWSARNAIFRDLITLEWPVIYDKGVALVYYIGFWIPAALVGKAVFLLGSGPDTAFFVGNLALLLWSVICVVTAMLLVAVLLRADTKKRFALVILLFICFSGVDVIGYLISSLRGFDLPEQHLDGWTPYQFSSMATCLGWVFNQAVLAWLAVACFLNERTTRNYAFLIVLCAASSPMPCVGLAVYMIGLALCQLWTAVKEKTVPAFLKNVFTVQNILPTVFLLPVYLLYYATNLAVNVGQEMAGPVQERDYLFIAIVGAFTVALLIASVILRRKGKTGAGELIWLAVIFGAVAVLAVFNPNVRMRYLLALLAEALVYLALVWYDNRRSPLFYLTLILSLMCPLIHVGTTNDFCWRASIPAVFVMMTLCARYLLEHGAVLTDLAARAKVHVARTVTTWILVVALFLGGFTVLQEFARGFGEVVEQGRINAVNDTTVTFNQVFEGEMKNLDRNFTAVQYEDTLFYRYLAK